MTATDTPTLFDALSATMNAADAADVADDLDARFAAFHADHPEVYEHLVRLARQAVAAGHNRIGIATLYERLRWEYMVGDLTGDGYKLNNSWRSRYARLIAAQEADLADVFETRELRS